MSYINEITNRVVKVFRRIVYGPNGTYYTNEPDVPELTYCSVCGVCIEDENYLSQPVLRKVRAHAEEF